MPAVDIFTLSAFEVKTPYVLDIAFSASVLAFAGSTFEIRIAKRNLRELAHLIH